MQSEDTKKRLIDYLIKNLIRFLIRFFVRRVRFRRKADAFRGQLTKYGGKYAKKVFKGLIRY